MKIFAKIFKRRNYRKDPVLSFDGSYPFLEGESPKTISPYVEQIQEFMEEHLCADDNMEPVHNLNQWLLIHPEFLPNASMES